MDDYKPPQMVMKFELEIPEEVTKLQLLINGEKLLSKLEDFENDMRQLYKYENKRTIEIEEVRKRIREVQKVIEIESNRDRSMTWHKILIVLALTLSIYNFFSN